MGQCPRTHVGFSQLADRCRNSVRCFQDHTLSAGPRAGRFLNPSKASPTSSGLLGHKALRIIFLLSPHPHHRALHDEYLNSVYLIPERRVEDMNSHRCEDEFSFYALSLME